MTGGRIYLEDDPELGIEADDRPAVVERHVARYEWAAEVLKLAGVEGVPVYDFGCGSGHGGGIVASVGCKYHGIDVDEEALAYAKKHYASEEANISFGLGGFGSLEEIAQIQPGRWVMALESLEHVSLVEQWKWIEACAAAKLNILIACPVHMSTLPEALPNPHHEHEPVLGEISETLLQAGYSLDMTLTRYESTYGPATQALIAAHSGYRVESFA